MRTAIPGLVPWPTGKIGRLIRVTDRLREFERWYAAERTAARTYPEALAIFAALWGHARQLNSDFPSEWQADVAADVELARVLNGLPES